MNQTSYPFKKAGAPPVCIQYFHFLLNKQTTSFKLQTAHGHPTKFFLNSPHSPALSQSLQLCHKPVFGVHPDITRNINTHTHVVWSIPTYVWVIHVQGSWRQQKSAHRHMVFKICPTLFRCQCLQLWHSNVSVFASMVYLNSTCLPRRYLVCVPVGLCMCVCVNGQSSPVITAGAPVS